MSGKLPQCTLCHTTPPALNAYGLQIQTRFDGPVSAADFDEAIGPIIDDIMALDADGDGFDNEAELIAGTVRAMTVRFRAPLGAPREHQSPLECLRV